MRLRLYQSGAGQSNRRSCSPMTDWLNFPNVTPVSAGADRPGQGAVRAWLWIVAALVFAMVVVGGATRLTESGLSITEWKPVTGAIPPLSDADWAAAFEKYRQIPQYRELFPTMDLAGFKVIFLWEWSHRLLGRLIGVAFALPLAFFWLRGALSRRLSLQLLGVLALGALQGAVGWWMVASGLVNRVEVAQERLATHLLLASLTFAALVWLAVGLRRGAREEATGLGAKIMGWLLALVTLKQIFLGGLVAGLRAGLVYNTWPLMDGVFVPPFDHLMKLTPFWLNFFDNHTMVQFQHRMGAYVLLMLALINLAFAAGAGLKRGLALLALVLTQAGLGIATLVLSVPLWAGLAHQAFAMVVLAMVVVNLRACYPRNG